jgi:hypothetical protein
MSRVIGCVAAGIVLTAALTGCGSDKKGATNPTSGPTPTANGSGSNSASSTGVKGSGKVTMTVGTARRNFTVTCTRTATTTQATGNEGSDALTLTVKGTPVAAVLVTHGKDGSTTIYQAIDGLRDDNGKAVGKVSVTTDSDKYTGTGTFVLTKIDNKGKRARLTSNTSQVGQFQLTCGNGYAAVPTPSIKPSTPAKSSIRPSSTKTS